MKKYYKLIISVAILVVVVTVALGLFTFYPSFTGKFRGGSTINGVDVGKLNPEDAYTKVVKSLEDETVTLKDTNGTNLTAKLSDIATVSIDKDSIKDCQTKLFQKSFQLDSSCTVDKDGVKSFYESSVTLASPQDAYISKEDSKFVVMPESYGNMVDYDALTSSLQDNINKGTYSQDLTYLQPAIKTADLQDTCDKANSYLDWSVSYVGGEKIEGKDIIDSVTIDGTDIKVGNSGVKSFVSDLAKKENTQGVSREFTTTSGEKININGGTYGWVVNQSAEVKYLTDALNKQESSTDRTPEYSQTAKTKDATNDIGSTYIEVSIAKQHLWYYVNGVLSMESDIVTGQKGLHDTPTGVYYISEKVNGKYLVGTGYKTWVNKWMRLTGSGIGLHDATWRDTFGGSIYTYKGSHGCINLPPTFASQLYDAVETKLPVIIY